MILIEDILALGNMHSLNSRNGSKITIVHIRGLQNFRMIFKMRLHRSRFRMSHLLMNVILEDNGYELLIADTDQF